MKKRIYLDYNATSPLRPCARKAILDVLSLEDAALNASSIHSYGQQGRKIIEDARQNIAALIGLPPAQIIFNSGATEGNNTVIQYFAAKFPSEKILISAAEHPSILELTKTSENIEIIPIDENGLINLTALDKILSEHKISLVSCLWGSNETGAIQNIREISALAHKHGALFHTDATQAAGRIEINIPEYGIDFLTLSSHKIGGPQGVGALALGLCGQTPTMLHGGGQEKSARAGTENVAGIAGFGAAAKEAHENLDNYKKLALWRDKLETELAKLSPDIIFHAQKVERVANTSFFSLPNAAAQSLLMALDLEGIAISNGSACSSGSVKPSQTLIAMGKSKDIAANALRISMGWATKEEDIDTFLSTWKKVISRRK